MPQMSPIYWLLFFLLSHLFILSSMILISFINPLIFYIKSNVIKFIFPNSSLFILYKL